MLILSGGEPLMRRDIFEISERAKAMKFYVGLSSNGTLIDAPEVTLGEAPAGTTRSIAAWWYPGSNSGREFVYAAGEASWERGGKNASTVGD